MLTQLFIDGENFIHKVEEILMSQNIKKGDIDIENIDLKELVKIALKDFKIDIINFYSARLHLNQETLKKSQELILKQRILKSNLEKQGVNFILSGNVRAQVIKLNGKTKTVFKEKGVDVRLAVDMVSLSCDKTIDVAILCSSDSDLQPAVAELKEGSTNNLLRI